MGGSIITLNIQMDSQTFQIPDLQDSMTVYSLKKSVHAHSGVCIMDQTLLYNTTKLVDNRKLSSYNIGEGDTIVVEVEARTTPELFIESNSGTRVAQVAYNPENTVARVKQLIQAKTKIPSACLKLYFETTLLRDCVTLSSCKINEGDVLRLEIRLSDHPQRPGPHNSINIAGDNSGNINIRRHQHRRHQHRKHQATSIPVTSGNINTDDINTVNINIGYNNTDDINTGNIKIGYNNTDDINTGNINIGYNNTGEINIGNNNTGDNWDIDPET